uniref:Uncharacterized protein n=1 Tax=Arundo donax TaxID=35708 RepID=A0A0A9E346_ARUDO
MSYLRLVPMQMPRLHNHCHHSCSRLVRWHLDGKCSMTKLPTVMVSIFQRGCQIQT